MCDFCWSRAVACAPGEDGTGLGVQSGVGVSEVALGKIALLPGVHLGEGILPLQGQKTLHGPADSLSSARD